MKSWTSESGVQGVEGLAEKGSLPSAAASRGIFQAVCPFSAHWWNTVSVCGPSTTPAMSRPPLSASSARVARIGPEVITGDAIRTLRREEPMAVAIRCESCSP